MTRLSRGGLVWACLLVPAMVVAYLATAVFFMPRLLLFPYHRQVGGVVLYSDTPIPDAAVSVVTKANARLSASALLQPGETFKPIFLTDGGWRWTLLSVGAPHAFAVTRPSADSVIVNRSDFASDRVWRGSTPAGERSLSDVIAHERTHILIRRRFGTFADRLYPRWVREGYCDYVAGSSTLSDEEAAKLRRTGSRLSALVYYDARRRVAAILAANGGSVEKLFEGARAGDRAR
jgi:hypothetical protein